MIRIPLGNFDQRIEKGTKTTDPQGRQRAVSTDDKTVLISLTAGTSVQVSIPPCDSQT